MIFYYIKRKIILKEINTIGATRKCESNLSRIPPCPGIILPESFTPAFRLKKLSSKSPACPTTEQAAEINAIFQIEICAFASKIDIDGTALNKQKIVIERIIHHTKPPIAPEIVLLGLILGASFLPPNKPPLMYAKVSVKIGIRKANNKQKNEIFPSKPDNPNVAERSSKWFINTKKEIKKVGYTNTIAVFRALIIEYFHIEITSCLVFISLRVFLKVIIGNKNEITKNNNIVATAIIIVYKTPILASYLIPKI